MSIFKKLTYDYVEEITPHEIFRRGEDYYENGAVLALTYDAGDDTLTAAVAGSRRYTVTVVYISTKPQFYCTCPYTGANICKHGVAAALKIIQEPDSVKNLPLPPAADPEELDALYRNASTQQKEAFLLQILKENKPYRDKFRTLILGQVKVESTTTVEEIRDEVKEQLEAFDLCDYQRFYEDYDQRYGYREEWEILYNGATTELQDILNQYKRPVMENLIAGNIVEASKTLFGLYEGILLVDEDKIEDDMYIFEGGVAEPAFYIFSGILDNASTEFVEIEKNDDALKRISEIFFERVRSYRQSEQGAELLNRLICFKPFLLELITGTAIAKFWNTELPRLDMEAIVVDELLLKIADVLGDTKRWLNVARKNYKNNPEITRKLLDHYKQQDDRPRFVEVAKHAFAEWGSDFDSYLYENSRQEDDPVFFSQILAHYAEREKSLPLFREFKKRFGKESARSFIDSQKTNGGYDSEYYIKLLEEEKDYPTILKFVKKKAGDWNFVTNITPILNVYPADCFKIIRTKTNRFLENNLGRGKYTAAAGWLKLLLKINDKSISEKVQLYFDELFHTYNRRPALKDEFIRAGIRPTP